MLIEGYVTAGLTAVSVMELLMLKEPTLKPIRLPVMAIDGA
jgi:hypothetical protein